MQRFWDLASGRGLILRGHVFLSGHKMSAPGYRWAHSTLMQKHASLLFSDDKSSSAKITPHGLEIESVGGFIGITADPKSPLMQNGSCRSDQRLVLTKRSSLPNRRARRYDINIARLANAPRYLDEAQQALCSPDTS